MGFFALTALLSGACAHTGIPDWQLFPEASDLVFDDLAHSWNEAIPPAMQRSAVWSGSRTAWCACRSIGLTCGTASDGQPFGCELPFFVGEGAHRIGQLSARSAEVRQALRCQSGPSKIPGAAIEFPSLGRVSEVRLYLHNALCEVRWENGGRERAIIEATVVKLEACGPRWWTGYSYAWFANMKARFHDGEGGGSSDLAGFCRKLLPAQYVPCQRRSVGPREIGLRLPALYAGGRGTSPLPPACRRCHTGIIRIRLPEDPQPPTGESR